MAIPGMKPSYDVRAKVRIGEKKKTAKGKEYPASVDYFICDDPEFAVIAGVKPKELRIVLPFQTAGDNFSTGLEFWRGKQLTCYSKGETHAPSGLPIAYRVESMVAASDVKVGEPMGRGGERQPIACAFRECAFFKARDCKPMGRLQFFLEGGSVDQVYQLDTKSWNTIEGVDASLIAAAAGGDLRGRVFLLSVAIVQKATQKFPVVSLKEAPVNVLTSDDVCRADALLPLIGAVESGDDALIRRALAGALDVTNPGWKSNPDFVARITEIGVLEAAKGLLKRYDL